MGVGGRQPQGLWITTREVTYDPRTRELTRISETAVILQFGYSTLAQAAVVIRSSGLKIGMQFRQGHLVGPDQQHHWRIHFTAARTGTAVGALNWIALDEDPTVTALLGQVFSPNGQWRGYRIAGAQIPDNTAGPAPWPGAADRLFFKIVARNFAPPHLKDVHVVPMVCVLDTVPDFRQHYVLGIGAFTVGHRAGGLEFDSEVVTREPSSPPQLEPPAAQARARRTGAKRAKRPPAKRRAHAKRRTRATRRARR